MNHFYERRRAEVERINAQTIGPHLVSGKTLIVGTGEAIVSVSFPSTFTEEPTFFYGGALVDGTDLIGSALPTMSVLVASWARTQKSGTNLGYLYTGASLVVVTSGPADLQIWLHWTFLADALRNLVST